MGDVIWIIFGVIALILLAVYWKKRNAVWGGLTIGIIVILVVSLFLGFDWYIIAKGAVLGTIVGFIAELLGKGSDKMRKSKTTL